MAKALLGRKLGMSQVFSESGEVIPVTLILAEKNAITLRRTEETDGKVAVQIGVPRKNAKPLKKDSKITPGILKKHYAARREFYLDASDDATEVGVEQFEVGDAVQVSGTSKGKGYAGVVKRHHFKGGPASHGHRHALRQSGSIGAAFPQHVFKGTRMAGRMGSDRVTVKNLSVIAIDEKKNTIAIKGAVPGTRGGIVEILSMASSSNDENKDE